MRNHVRAVVPVIASLATVLPASAAATGWVTGQPVSPAGRVAIEPKVALTPSGERIVAWQQLQTGTHDVESTEVRVAPAGGDFGPVQSFPTGNDEDLSLSVGSDGTAVLVWSEETSAHNADLHIARRAPGAASFTEITPVSLGVRLSDAARVTVQGGDVYVALDTTDEQGTVISTAIRAVRLPAGTSQVQALSGPAGPTLDHASYDSSNQPASTVTGARIAVDGGTIHVIWEDLEDARGGNPNAFTFVRRATAAVGGSFSAPILLDTFPTNFFRAQDATPLIVAGAGRVDAAWARGEQGQLVYQELSSGGGPQTIGPNIFAENLHAGIDGAGALVLGWEQFSASDGTEGVLAATVPPGGPARPAVLLSPLTANRVLDDFVVGSDGSALAVPDRSNDNPFGEANAQVEASFRAAGGAFGALEEVSGAQDRTGDAVFDAAAGALGPDGRAVIGWSADDGSGVTNERIFVSERDATPPTITTLTVPASAGVGSRVSLSAVATDALAPVTVSWDFGDGAGARGTSVTHAYGAAGTYTVTVSARDGAGNVATQTRSITVQAAPDVTRPADTTPPLITELSVTNRRFRAGSGATALIAAAHRAPTGTTFRLQIDKPATLVLSLTGTVAGRRAGKACIPARTRGRRCTVAVQPGTIVRAGRGPGSVSIPFSGRVDARRLLPGSYAASLTAIDAAGNHSRPRTVAFTVVTR